MDFLAELLSAPGPSSFESRPAAVWRARAESYGAEVRSDAYGSVFATFGAGGAPRVMLAGHIDEIGLLVTYIDEGGFLFVQGIGGWDPQQLVGQRVRVLGRERELVGLIGKKAIHLMEPEERRKVSRIRDLWIDIGARSREEALEHVRPGDVAVVEQPFLELLGGRFASKAIDNRLGAYVVLEAARRAADAGAEVVAVATVQEEIGGVGAKAAAYALEPDVAIAVDVTHATDVPGADKKQEGDRALGSGPELSVGSYVHRGVLERLRELAEGDAIPYTMGFAARHTATDADEIAGVRAGVPTAVVSVPIRYMHSPNETVDREDVEHTVALLEAFVRGLEPSLAFEQP